MTLQLLVLTALRALRYHKIRTALTTLGISIGISAVVATISLGQSARMKIESEIASLGDNILILYAGSPLRSKNVSKKQKSPGAMTLRDVNTLERQVPSIKCISPIADGHKQVVSYQTQRIEANLKGGNEQFLSMLNRSLALGRPITQNDVASQQRVALIGSEAAKLLFKGADPLNNHIVINHQETSTRVKVIGVLKPVNDHRPMATPNLDIIIPYTTMQRRIRRVSLRWVDYIMISAINRDVVPQTVRQVTSIMRMRHNLKPEEANDFTVFDQLSLGNALGKSAQIVSLLLLIIACIALLIGGIGVMNIMLVSVSERTREIGIRMALGATTNQIMIQFLAEAIIICLLGGLVGCILGVTAPYALSGITGWPPVISVSAIITAFIVTTCVGIGAGLYPAYHAAKLDPVAALQEH